MKNRAMSKQTKLIAVVALSVIALAGTWFGLVSPQQAHLKDLAQRKVLALKRLEDVTSTIKKSEGLPAELASRKETLAKMEKGMASGDIYAWTINTVRDFKQKYRIEIPQFGQVDGPKDTNLLPQFPYKQASLTISGSGHFEELGKFVADFENEYPYIRLANLNVEAPPTTAPGDGEKLVFRMDVITLVKPGNS